MRATVLIAIAAALVACGGSGEPEPAPEQPETVFEPLTETLDRAESVEDTLREQSEELRRRVEEAER